VDAAPKLDFAASFACSHESKQKSIVHHQRSPHPTLHAAVACLRIRTPPLLTSTTTARCPPPPFPPVLPAAAPLCRGASLLPGSRRPPAAAHEEKGQGWRVARQDHGEERADERRSVRLGLAGFSSSIRQTGYRGNTGTFIVRTKEKIENELEKSEKAL
jgi:hypothetical protein